MDKCSDNSEFWYLVNSCISSGLFGYRKTLFSKGSSKPSGKVFAQLHKLQQGRMHQGRGHVRLLCRSSHMGGGEQKEGAVQIGAEGPVFSNVLPKAIKCRDWHLRN